MAKDNVGPGKKRFGPSRSDLLDKKEARGHGKSSLWYFYSGKVKQDIAVSSDPEYLHAILMEGDPEVTNFTINPPPYIVPVGNDMHETTFDALVTRKSKKPQLREVKAYNVDEEKGTTRDQHQMDAQIAAVEKLGYEYLRVGPRELAAREQFLSNWRRARPFIAAAKYQPLEQFKNAAISAANRRKRSTLKELADGVQLAELPLFYAACFSLVQFGQLQSDLDKKPLSLSSVFWIEGARDE